MKLKLKYPRSLKRRLKTVAKQHDFRNVDALIEHFLIRGLAHYGVTATVAEVPDKLNVTVVDQGYSSIDELVEHLLLRGLNAYEQTSDDPAELERRLRGLGYID